MVVRPGVMIRLESGETLLYEVVRSQPFWEKTLADKLARYETVFRNIARTDYDGAEEPVLILCAENETHAARMWEIAEGKRTRSFSPMIFSFSERIFTDRCITLTGTGKGSTLSLLCK